MYLGRYGYLSSDMANGNSDDSISKFKSAVSDFQKFAGIEETGKTDSRCFSCKILPFTRSENIRIKHSKLFFF